MFFKKCIIALNLLFLTGFSYGEYQLFTISDFENSNGKWHEALMHGHYSTPLTTRVIDWNSTPMKDDLMQESTIPFIGNYGLELRPLETDPHLSMTDHRALTRSKLGTNGAALFQVDFFVPENTATYPTMAILANGFDDGDRSTYQFYRFGIDRDRVFFSFTNKKSSPDMYHRQSLQDFSLTKGWHRLQMVVKGNGEIVCAIDGQTTDFSPIVENTLNILEPGVMVTRGSDASDSVVYADNLQIHWTLNSNDYPPKSPWAEDSGPYNSAMGFHAINWDIGGFDWMISPAEAWNESQSSGKVIFTLFHDPNDPNKEQLINLLRTNEAIPVLGKCILLRVDVSKSSGANFAQRYNLNQFPVVGVIDNQGNMMSSATISPNSTWASVYGQLSGGN